MKRRLKSTLISSLFVESEAKRRYRSEYQLISCKMIDIRRNKNEGCLRSLVATVKRLPNTEINFSHLKFIGPRVPMAMAV